MVQFAPLRSKRTNGVVAARAAFSEDSVRAFVESYFKSKTLRMSSLLHKFIVEPMIELLGDV